MLDHPTSTENYNEDQNYKSIYIMKKKVFQFCWKIKSFYPFSTFIRFYINHRQKHFITKENSNNMQRNLLISF